MAVTDITVTHERPGLLRPRVIDSIVNSGPVEREAAEVDRDRFWNDLVA
jgi:hypothetical protein